MRARSSLLIAERGSTGYQATGFKGFLRRNLRVICALVLAIELLATAAVARADKPPIDQVYVDGQTYYMIAPHMITDPSLNLFAQSQELYLLAYPTPPGTTAPITLASGYQPQCNPCMHPGLPLAFVHHDHVLTGAPGLGTNGTAGQFKGPWKVIVLMYNPSVLSDPHFVPVTSVTALDEAEAKGEFLPINTDPNATNPYEVVTGNVLICPLVSPHA